MGVKEDPVREYYDRKYREQQRLIKLIKECDDPDEIKELEKLLEAARYVGD